MSEEEFDSDQTEAITLCAAGQNIFITGSGGVGKSHVLKAIIRLLRSSKKKVAVTASTGVAAVNINGVTVHSYFKWHPDQMKDVPKKCTIWEEIDVLILDEISMLHPDFFTWLESQARVSRPQQSKLPFGGVQLVCVGDFFQLPPIHDKKHAKPAVEFVFETQAWKSLDLQTIQLSIVHRQNEKDFIEILERIRRGKINGADERFIRSLADNKEQDQGDGIAIRRTELFCHNEDVDSKNRLALAALPGAKWTWENSASFVPNLGKKEPAGITDIIKKVYKSLPIEPRLELKIGAQVMLVVNVNVKCGLANGSRGVVLDLSKEGFPIVQFDKDKIMVRPYLWEINHGNIGKIVVQCIPLRLAWCMTIHKSQGSSITHLDIHLKKVFADGQFYVAISRAASTKNLCITGFKPEVIRVNPKVVEFYNQLS